MVNFLLLISLVFLFSRGAIEVFAPKSFAYLVSVSIFFAPILGCIIFRKIVIKSNAKDIAVAVIFIASSLVSLIATLLSGADYGYSFYMVFPVVISVGYVIFSGIKLIKCDWIKIERYLNFLIYFLLSFAVLQQLGLVELPGDTLNYLDANERTRPSSLTGSYLHYPLIMVLLAASLHSIRGKLGVASFVGYVSPFIAFSRSGMLLVVLMAAIFALLNARKLFDSISLRGVFSGFFLLIVVVSCSFIFRDLFLSVIDRLLSMLNLRESGNEGRIDAWVRGVNIFFDGNILFGSHFGMVTNLTGNLTALSSVVVESGFIQNLINFGIVGTVIFYTIFLRLAKISESVIFKCFFLAFFIQSFVYQSTEVAPFVLGFMFFAAVIRCSKRSLSGMLPIHDRDPSAEYGT